MRLPSPRTRRVLLGLLLVATPLWGPALDLTGLDYTYESAEITVEENRLVIPNEEVPSKLWHGVDGFDCYYHSAPVPRSCALEATALNGSVAADHPDVTYSTNGYLGTDERYLAYADGRVFRYESAWEDGHYVLWTNRTSAATALRAVSRPAGSSPSAVETAIREGSVETDDELWPDEDGARVVELDGDTYLVYQTGSRRTMKSNPAVEAALTWLAVVFGAATLFGGRDRTGA